MASQDWIQDAELELAEKFTEETGIKVDYQIVPADQYTNLLMTKLNTGECTDIFASQAGQFDIVTQLNVEKNALDLSDSEWVSRLDPLAGAEVSVNGKVYGQPIQDVSSVWAIAYALALRATEAPYIWTGKDGTRPCNPSYFRDRFRQGVETVGGVRLLTPHSCRHTYVSQLQAQGVPLEIIQSLVGHADLDMTEHYLHVQENVRQEAAEKLAALFKTRETA